MREPKWLRHFGLGESPFSKDLDDSDLWLPSSRKDVVDDLAIETPGAVLLPHEYCATHG